MMKHKGHLGVASRGQADPVRAFLGAGQHKESMLKSPGSMFTTRRPRADKSASTLMQMLFSTASLSGNTNSPKGGQPSGKGRTHLGLVIIRVVKGQRLGQIHQKAEASRKPPHRLGPLGFLPGQKAHHQPDRFRWPVPWPHIAPSRLLKNPAERAMDGPPNCAVFKKQAILATGKTTLLPGGS